MLIDGTVRLPCGKPGFLVAALDSYGRVIGGVRSIDTTARTLSVAVRTADDGYAVDDGGQAQAFATYSGEFTLRCPCGADHLKD